jgi:hypothetical protein
MKKRERGRKEKKEKEKAKRLRTLKTGSAASQYTKGGKQTQQTSSSSKKKKQNPNKDTKGTEDPWVCVLCNILFKDENDIVLECEVCLKHYCSSCLRVCHLALDPGVTKPKGLIRLG